MTRQPLRRVFSIVNGGTPTSERVNWDGDISWATPVDLARLNGARISETERTLTVEGLRTGSSLVPAGSLIVSTRAPIGYVAETTTPMAFNQGCRGLVPRIAVDVRFFRYQLLVCAEQLQSQGQGSTFVELSTDALASFPLVVPPVSQQRAIADYLDAETARIDALVLRKTEVLRLLEMRRAALVDALVARHADATPRNELPWLTAVPSRWPSVALGLLAEVFNGSTPPRDEADTGDIPWTTSGDLDQGVVTEPTAYISEATRRCHGLRLAPAGSIVVGLVGQGRTRGLSAKLAISTTLNQNLAAIVTRDGRLDPSYLGLLLSLAYDDLRNGGRGGNQAALNCEILKAYRIPLAPAEEQRQLVETVERASARDSVFASHLTRSIELLQERRKSLITAAVTGQLEIPGVAA